MADEVESRGLRGYLAGEQDGPGGEAMPLCPECGVSDGFGPIGPYRSQCVVCGAVLKNEEVGR